MLLPSSKIAFAAAALACAAGFAPPALAQYSGNPALQNPAANSGGSGATFRGSGSRTAPSADYYTPGQRRLNIPGARSNPSLRGTDLGVPPCPPSTPNCNPTAQ